MQDGSILRCSKCYDKMKVINSRVVFEEESLYRKRKYICKSCKNLVVTKEPLVNMVVMHYSMKRGESA